MGTLMLMILGKALMSVYHELYTGHALLLILLDITCDIRPCLHRLLQLDKRLWKGRLQSLVYQNLRYLSLVGSIPAKSPSAAHCR